MRSFQSLSEGLFISNETINAAITMTLGFQSLLVPQGDYKGLFISIAVIASYMAGVSMTTDVFQSLLEGLFISYSPSGMDVRHDGKFQSLGEGLFMSYQG